MMFGWVCGACEALSLCECGSVGGSFVSVGLWVWVSLWVSVCVCGCGCVSFVFSNCFFFFEERRVVCF